MPNVNSGMEFTYSARNAVGGPIFDKAPSIIFQPNGFQNKQFCIKLKFSSVLFECLCNANPQPTVKWILKHPSGERELTGDRYVSKVKKQVGKYSCTLIVKASEIKCSPCHLLLQNPNQQDQGIYKVVATNPQGTCSVEQNFTLKCTAKDVFKPIDSYI